MITPYQPYFDPNFGWRLPALHSSYIPHGEWNRSPQPPHAGGPERIEERHPHTAHINWAGMFPDEIILKGPDLKEVALTFDDGPDDEWTPKILDVLRNSGIKATFFCIGQRIRKNPEVFRRNISEGHAVGNHTWDHPNLTKIPISAVKSEIERTNDEMFRLVGIRSSMFRPPYGALNADVIREVIQLKEKIVFWDVDNLDWFNSTTGLQ
jgi:peptidoglycan-N-acetylglucosamine deacetylase